jgi:HAD superfamily hydrolase (TIGR01509 family)
MPGQAAASGRLTPMVEPLPGIVRWPSRPAPAPPGALVFDLDGTLVDTVEARVAGWLAAFDELGFQVAPAAIRRLIGADGRLVARLGAQLAGRDIDEAAAERIDRRAGELFNRLNADPRPLPGARELLLDLARAGTPHAIATASRADQVRASVDALELPSPPPIVDGGHVRRAKPAPDLLLLAARRLRVPPRACWYVGDAVWDMQAARAAGMTATGVATGFATADELLAAGADLAAADLYDLRRRMLAEPAP